MKPSKPRRQFLKQSLMGSAAAGMGSASLLPAANGLSQGARKDLRFRISLAGWSLHRAIQGNLVKMLDFPRIARHTFGLDAIEPVNTLFEVPTAEYLARLNKNARDEGVKILLIMCDAEGALAHKDKGERMKAVQNHHKWVDIAAELGCHSIRVNMRGEEKGTAGNAKAVDEFISRSVDAFSALCEYGAKSKINVIIENHGGLSSNADVLVRLMKAVNLPNFGTLPDFGNFDPGTDRYESTRKLMPYAKGVSAKTHDFDSRGNETQIDYDRMMKIVLDEAKFSGYVDIEYEGNRLNELRRNLGNEAAFGKVSVDFESGTPIGPKIWIRGFARGNLGAGPEAGKKCQTPCRERSPQRSPLGQATDFKWLGHSTRKRTASVPTTAPLFGLSAARQLWGGGAEFGDRNCYSQRYKSLLLASVRRRHQVGQAVPGPP